MQENQRAAGVALDPGLSQVLLQRHEHCLWRFGLRVHLWNFRPAPERLQYSWSGFSGEIICVHKTEFM